ncbi:MAG: hypothetical protein QM703_28725 [Gemmatales bacterium]
MRCRKLSLLVMLLFSGYASAQTTPAATYFFNNSLVAEQVGVPALTATDPLSANAFVTQSVFGQSRTVYAFNGSALPVTSQAGLTFDNSGTTVTPTNYTAELVFQFSQNANAWRRILDVQNRTSDSGFYVDPSNNLDIFPVAGSSGLFTNNAYHHVVLTVTAGTTAKAYLDGVLQFTSNTNLMNINNGNNPGNLINLFLDNTSGGGQGEYSSGDIALFRLYDAVLSDSEIATLAANPFAAVPEPSTIVLGTAACIGMAGYIRLHRKKRRRLKKKV